MNAFKKILVTIAAAATLGDRPHLDQASAKLRLWLRLLWGYGGYGYNNYPSYGYGMATVVPRTTTATVTATAVTATATAPGNGGFPCFPSTRRDFQAPGRCRSTRLPRRGRRPLSLSVERAFDEKHLGFVDAAELTPGGVGLGRQAPGNESDHGLAWSQSEEIAWPMTQRHVAKNSCISLATATYLVVDDQPRRSTWRLTERVLCRQRTRDRPTKKPGSISRRSKLPQPTKTRYLEMLPRRCRRKEARPVDRRNS